MYYIVLDMEWNQPWPGSPSARKALPIHGEILQIGAVRVLEDQNVADEFQILVKPHFYKRINQKVQSLTGIKEARIKAEGVPFDEALERFRGWCGQDAVFLTWGFDDIMILRENLTIHNLPADWVLNWYNAQMIFNAQTDGSANQRALKTAMEQLGIEATRQAHDALGDAYHTALVCSRLDLAKGIAEYGKSVKAHEDGFHGAELPGCKERRVFHGYRDKADVLEKFGGEENQCPDCGRKMKIGRWYAQPGRRYMTMSVCPEHGSFLVRIRLQTEEDGSLRVSRLLYAGDSEAAKAYERAAAQQKKYRPRRRRRSALRAAAGKPETTAQKPENGA